MDPVNLFKKINLIFLKDHGWIPVVDSEEGRQQIGQNKEQK